ncbi:thiamine-phosphate pyrophosphorylase [Gloeothece citriformis PCC 7424]|uniref:Thiamine-phosphate synthase n=1 Tax=Gloeothece citriformis (strain PCC 7424) TaxID=65393 RepID=B7K9V6_GLOC7|nr:thiamine phosphate synthase [Gloeothece citriformis]ACK71312.1 thiamine-phosphate pyrophosphorylase [Gloeothece citriformis PCC 7424]
MDEHYSQIRGQQSAIERILDANLDRAREGLRIIEEWCRFGLNNSQLAEDCKEMRQELASWHSTELRMARDTPGDPGTELTHPQEETRNSIEQLLQANLCRIEEALRVLEEYGKLYHPKMGVVFKQMRYRVYTLESNLLGFRRHHYLRESLLYLVTSPSENLISVVESALSAGLTLVQYRDKQTDDLIRLSIAHKLCQLCHEYGALFIVNDRVDIALAVNADGVHLGQQDIPISLARGMLGSQKIIGRSTTNPQEMQQAIAQGADYIGVGPVYETPTKAGKAAAGLDYVRYAAKHSPIPWFAIGGIDTSNLKDVLMAGAQRVSIVRAIMQAEKPALVTGQLLSVLSRKRTFPPVDPKPNVLSLTESIEQ